MLYKYTIIICICFLLISCIKISTIPYRVGNPYGARVAYGEGKHPGIDYDIPAGTPIIAAADGIIVHIGDPCGGEWWCGGRTVWIGHMEFFTGYSHLKKVLVKRHQRVKRGELIGLSGASNNGYEHLHYGVIQIGGMGRYYSQTYNPNDFWLNGEAKCYDPKEDYSKYTAQDLTFPVACGEYRETLLSKLKK